MHHLVGPETVGTGATTSAALGVVELESYAMKIGSPFRLYQRVQLLMVGSKEGFALGWLFQQILEGCSVRGS